MEKSAAELDLAERLRIQTLCQALGALGQGIVFFHAGCELLRSKSLDRDSYNSGTSLSMTVYIDMTFSIKQTISASCLPLWVREEHLWLVCYMMHVWIEDRVKILCSNHLHLLSTQNTLTIPSILRMLNFRTDRSVSIRYCMKAQPLGD